MSYLTFDILYDVVIEVVGFNITGEGHDRHKSESEHTYWLNPCLEVRMITKLILQCAPCMNFSCKMSK